MASLRVTLEAEIFEPSYLHDRKETHFRYKIAKPIIFCCTSSKIMLDTQDSLDQLKGKLVIGSPHFWASNRLVLPISFCPFCSEKIEYEVIGKMPIDECLACNRKFPVNFMKNSFCPDHIPNKEVSLCQ